MALFDIGERAAKARAPTKMPDFDLFLRRRKSLWLARPSHRPTLIGLRCRAISLLALVACLAHAGPVELDADFIWNDSDARDKCPRVCEAKSLYWTGT